MSATSTNFIDLRPQAYELKAQVEELLRNAWLDPETSKDFGNQLYWRSKNLEAEPGTAIRYLEALKNTIKKEIKFRKEKYGRG